jgi:uncharacterized protein (UPF0335 family)
MAKPAEEHNADNVDSSAMKSYVERLFDIEQSFADQKAEYQDSKADLKTEIKGRADETGVDFKQVAALVKIRMNEAAALDEQAAHDTNVRLYEELFGFSAQPSELADDDDALA